MKISSNVASDSNDENNFSHKLLLINAHFLKLREPFANNSYIILNNANIELSKIPFHKIGHQEGC